MTDKKYKDPTFTISKVYTKTGDNGKTSLVGGQKVLKSNVRTEELDSLIIRGNVFMSQKDSLYSDRFNQIKGEKLDGFFSEGNLARILRSKTLPN